MIETNYNKLVRDKIPEIIECSNKIPVVKKVEKSRVQEYLVNKLYEELDEYKNSGNIEELADILEAIHGIVFHNGYSWERLEALRLEKLKRCGGFENGLVLQKVIEP